MFSASNVLVLLQPYIHCQNEAISTVKPLQRQKALTIPRIFKARYAYGMFPDLLYKGET